MKKYVLFLGVLFICSVCFAQNSKFKDSIQLCYKEGLWAASLGPNHCITIVIEGDSMYLTRKCYPWYLIPKCTDSTILPLSPNLTFDYDFEWYEQSVKRMILCYYEKNERSLTLDENVLISKSQFDEFVKICNEIKMYESANMLHINDLLLTLERFHYVIKDKNETAIIIDWDGSFDRRKDIEKALGLRRYSRCPCVKAEMKQAKLDDKKLRKQERRSKLPKNK